MMQYMIQSLLSRFAQAAPPTGPCAPKQSFFGLPTWYEFLPTDANCGVKIDFSNHPEQFWQIGLGIADILLVVAGGIAVLFVIYGGYQYMTSQFDPEGTKKGKDTVLNALIGLIVVILASTIVKLVGRTLG
jgi:hypothetical protein